MHEAKLLASLMCTWLYVLITKGDQMLQQVTDCLTVFFVPVEKSKDAV